MLGISKNAVILPLKFMQGTSGDVKNAIEAIKYAHSLGVKIINCSWNMSTYNQELYDVIKEYDDILFVCSAGNELLNLDNEKIYPASFELNNVISVMAMNNQGAPYDCSGHGRSVSIAAPSESIISLLPENDIKYINGTSVAAAFVSGAAAIITGYNSDLTPAEIKDIIIKSSTKDEKMSGYNSCGGYLNIYEAVKEVLQ